MLISSDICLIVIPKARAKLLAVLEHPAQQNSIGV